MVVLELGGGGAEPVSVAEAKTWCRIERSDEDSLIGALIAAARETAERETRTVLVKRGFRIVVDTVPADRTIWLPRTPFGAVTSVTAYGVDGTPRSFPATSARADRLCGADVLRLSEEAATAAANGIEIDFTAGFEPVDVPNALKLAVKQIVAASYDVRGAVATDMQPSIFPKAARDLIAPFRELRL